MATEIMKRCLKHNLLFWQFGKHYLFFKCVTTKSNLNMLLIASFEFFCKRQTFLLVHHSAVHHSARRYEGKTKQFQMVSDFEK